MSFSKHLLLIFGFTGIYLAYGAADILSQTLSPVSSIIQHASSFEDLEFSLNALERRQAESLDKSVRFSFKAKQGKPSTQSYRFQVRNHQPLECLIQCKIQGSVKSSNIRDKEIGTSNVNSTIHEFRWLTNNYQNTPDESHCDENASRQSVKNYSFHVPARGEEFDNGLRIIQEQGIAIPHRFTQYYEVYGEHNYWRKEDTEYLFQGERKCKRLNFQVKRKMFQRVRRTPISGTGGLSLSDKACLIEQVTKVENSKVDERMRDFLTDWPNIQIEINLQLFSFDSDPGDFSAPRKTTQIPFPSPTLPFIEMQNESTHGELVKLNARAVLIGNQCKTLDIDTILDFLEKQFE